MIGNEEKERLIREAIFRNIATGAAPHGGFLTAFADAYVRADLSNQAILDDAAKTLITKYDLEQEQVDAQLLNIETII